MRLYLVRHAEPTLAGRFIGRTDPPLSERGVEQALAMLPGLAVDHVFVSPLARAQETASFINAARTTLDDLAELHFGDWEGLTWDEIAARDPALAERKLANWFSEPAPNGESLADLLSRVSRALHRIRSEPYSRAAIVAHAAVNGAIRSLLTGGDPASYRQQYVEIIELET
jgi:broad specificity phosphatase PhoE